MTTQNFFAEVTFGQYAYASLTGYVSMGEQRFVVEMIYREGGQKNQEVRAENLTYGVAKGFFRSEYITDGIWKRLMQVMDIAKSSQLEQPAAAEPAEEDQACPMCKENALVIGIHPVNGKERAECYACGYYHHEAEEVEPAAEQLTLVNCYECNGSLSLDREYLEAMADGKGEIVARSVSLPADIIDDLLEANQNTFDVDYYNYCLEHSDYDGANEYWAEHHKCVPTPKYGFNW